MQTPLQLLRDLRFPAAQQLKRDLFVLRAERVNDKHEFFKRGHPGVSFLELAGEGETGQTVQAPGVVADCLHLAQAVEELQSYVQTQGRAFDARLESPHEF